MGRLVPLGYEADGSTVKINEAEAATVRDLYRLYRKHRTIRGVKQEADDLGLRSKPRQTAAGTAKGGTPIDRGHIYQILTNPLYAGRIRHRKPVYEGLHQAIIAPAIWEEVQQALQQKAAHRRREGKTAADPSPLIGKMFDETGDRLTPSHSNKDSKRHRYYVSHRLVKRAGETGQTGWRLPAKALERQIIKSMRLHLSKIASPQMICDLTSDEILRIRLEAERADSESAKLFALIDRIDIAAGTAAITLNEPQIVELTGVGPERLKPVATQITLPFQRRKRGVETRFVLGNIEPERDEALIRNIAKAHHWLGMICAGQSFDDIAKTVATSKRRV
ncbi:MAG: recombinase family protein [Rhodobacteraceae bacterium]|nr:recombinase family protein [Paracoccaceae bacterium]